LSNIYDRRENESLMDYEERLYRNQSLYSLSWEEINNLLGIEQHYDSTRKASYGYIKRINQEKEHNFDKSVMIINDLHLPFEREDVLEIINKHKDEINTLVIGGDLMDCKSISFFPQIRDITLEEELVYTHEFLKKVRKILDNEQKIIIINGNHEERWYKDICTMHEKDMQKFINPNLIDMIIEGFTIYEEDKKKKYEGIDGIIYIPHWFVNIDNKIIVSHPKDFSRVDGKMCEKTSEHFLNRDEEFEIIVFGHTHKYSQMTVSRRQNTYVVENGCLCCPQDYADVGKLGYTPQYYCYTIIKYNNNEKINYNNIQVYHLDELNNEEKKEKYSINL
jgi:predicted phosphodiesterase